MYVPGPKDFRMLIALKIQKKLEFYKTFKDEYSTSDYLYQLRHYEERQNFVKFKISKKKKKKKT